LREGKNKPGLREPEKGLIQKRKTKLGSFGSGRRPKRSEEKKPRNHPKFLKRNEKEEVRLGSSLEKDLKRPHELLEKRNKSWSGSEKGKRGPSSQAYKGKKKV